MVLGKGGMEVWAGHRVLYERPLLDARETIEVVETVEETLANPVEDVDDCVVPELKIN